MKVVVLVPSKDYKGNAGARIRYGRLAPLLADQGVTLSLEDIAQFDTRTAQCDVLLISKCHDARSILIGEVLARRGTRIGVDLFDDYFSQQSNSRLIRLRRWLSQLIERCDFAMCSTKAMASVVAEYAPGVPVHVLNDPAPRVDWTQLPEVLANKLSNARPAREIRLCWFGIGDNPHFPVGLSDLSAFADTMARLAAHEFAVHLSILTNARALDAARLSMISKLPLPVTIDEWTEAREAQLLRDSLVCFLPVNAQSFSTAKSLNRAITAMSSGCQILSAGYPLYASLDPLIYRDAGNFLEDLRGGSMRLSDNSIDRFRERVDTLASPDREASALVAFFKGLDPSANAVAEAAPLYLIHGFATTEPAHALSKTLGGFSVGSPFCTANLDFDVIFRARPGDEPEMRVSDRTLPRLRAEFRSRAADPKQMGSTKFWAIPRCGGEPSAPAWTDMSVPLQLALYPSTMKLIQERLEEGFGAGRFIFSETSPLPFHASA
jgi:hypothetical protein